MGQSAHPTESLTGGDDLGAFLDATLVAASAPVQAWSGLAAFYDAHVVTTRVWKRPFDRGVLGGAAADRLGPAFVAAYQEALRTLLPGLERERVVSLCATEAGGAHPSSMTTRLEPRPEGGWTLTGQKQWATAVASAGLLLVVATTGRDETGRNRLRVARVDGDAAGLRFEAMPPPPFVPEIPHARVHLDGVPLAADALLPGDGYTTVLKPFRTVEDVHVVGASLGYLLRVALGAAWPEPAVEALLAALVTARALAAASPGSPGVHLAVAGLLREQQRLLERLAAHWERVDAETRARWERDRPLLGVAGTARERRREVAWQRIREQLGPREPGRARL